MDVMDIGGLCGLVTILLVAILYWLPKPGNVESSSPSQRLTAPYTVGYTDEPWDGHEEQPGAYDALVAEWKTGKYPQADTDAEGVFNWVDYAKPE